MLHHTLKPWVREGRGWGDGGRNPRTGEGEGRERKGDCVCSLLEIHENRESGRFTKEENKSNICKHVYVELVLVSYLHIVVVTKERHRYVLNPLQTPTLSL